MQRGTTGSPILRPLASEDFPALADMWVAAWRAAYPHIDFDARRAWFAEHVRDLQRDGAQAIVAARGEAVDGFLLIDPQTGYLDQIVVAPERRGDGIAAQLLDKARRLSPSHLELHVNQDNALAIRFYEKHGFSIAGADVNARSGAPTFRMVWTGRA